MTVKFNKPELRVVLVDINPSVVRAWKAAFADTPEVAIVKGSILTQAVDAWFAPTNSRGRMDGGVDAVVKRHFGAQIERAVQNEIANFYSGLMPVGAATCVPTGELYPRFLISAPTMVQSAENVSETLNVALACAAAFQAIHIQNAKEPGSITSVAIPGLGAATGRVPPHTCANLMWTAYTLFNDHDFRDYDSLRETIEEQFAGFGKRVEKERVRVLPPELVGGDDEGDCCYHVSK